MHKRSIKKAWDKWLNSNEGHNCTEGYASGHFLENRLWYAFMAGIEAGVKSRMPRRMASHQTETAQGTTLREKPIVPRGTL